MCVRKANKTNPGAPRIFECCVFLTCRANFLFNFFSIESKAFPNV
jgi:hypothetical protein